MESEIRGCGGCDENNNVQIEKEMNTGTSTYLAQRMDGSPAPETAVRHN